MAPEVVAKISAVRQKIEEGTATIEELREAVALMQSDRKVQTAYTPSGSRKSKPKAQTGTADEMLDELGSLK